MDGQREREAGRGGDRLTRPDPVRLTQEAPGGGCACKLPAGDLEALLGTAGLARARGALLVGPEDGDDAAVVRLDDHTAVISTTDFFTPLVDDPFDWGRVAAANALSDVYAMGGRPVAALNLLQWPRVRLPMELAGEVLRGGAAVCAEADCPLAGGHSIDGPVPTYGLAATGVVHPDRMLRNDAGRAGVPLTLTKPLGTGVLANRHKQRGGGMEEAVASMVTLNRGAAELALAQDARCATDVTGFGLLGHLHKLCRASGVGAVVESARVPYLAEVRGALAAGHVPGGSRRNLDWVRPHLVSRVPDDELLLLADAQTSGGLLVAGELPGHPVVGHLTADAPGHITVV